MGKVYLEELNYVARRLRVHARTVLRTVHGDPRVYWTSTMNPDVNLQSVAEAFGIEFNALYAALYGDDDLLTSTEAAAVLGVHERTLRKRRKQHPPVLRHGKVVRYSRLSLSSK